MSQQVITSWELFIELLNSTMRQQNATKMSTHHQEKRYSRSSKMMSQQVKRTWKIFIKLMDVTVKQKCATKRH